MNPNESIPNEENILDSIKKSLRPEVARNLIEQELKTGHANTWIECFESILYGILMSFSETSKKNLLEKGLISEEDFNNAKEKLKELGEEIKKLKPKHRSRLNPVPDEVKEDLIKRLNVFSE